MSNPVVALLPSNIIEVYVNQTWLDDLSYVIHVNILDDTEMIQYY